MWKRVTVVAVGSEFVAEEVPQADGLCRVVGDFFLGGPGDRVAGFGEQQASGQHPAWLAQPWHTRLVIQAHGFFGSSAKRGERRLWVRWRWRRRSPRAEL